MCGEIARRGRLHCIATPHHDVIGTMIRAIEEKNHVRTR
jgi:ketopantoate reductase